MGDIVGLKGEKVKLVPPDKTLHLDNALRWLNDPEVVQYLMNTAGVTRGMEEDWFERSQKRESDFVWAILDLQDRHIGFTGIHRINWRLRLGVTGYKREGIARKKLFWEAQWHDTVLYGLLDEDYFSERRS